MKVVVTTSPPPLPAGVALYEHVGGIGGEEGGAEGGWQSPSQSTMYSTYRWLPSNGFSSTSGVAWVTKEYALSGLGGSAMRVAHSKKPRPSTTAPSDGLHLPCTCSLLTSVLMTYSLGSSKSVSLTETVR